MNYTDCDYYSGRIDSVGYCGLNECLCLVDAFKEECEEIEDDEVTW